LYVQEGSIRQAAKHLGKLTGLLGCFCWLALAAWQELIAHVKTYTHSFTACMVLAAVLPLIGFAAMVLLWGRDESKAIQSGVAPPEPPTGIRPAADRDGVLVTR